MVFDKRNKIIMQEELVNKAKIYINNTIQNPHF